MVPPMERVLKIESRVSSIGSSSDSLFLALSAWTYELGNGCNLVRETAPQASAVLPASPLDACIKESGSSYPTETQSARSSSSTVVGQGGQCAHGPGCC